MVDITILIGVYFMVYKPTNITMGPHPVAYGLFLWPSALPSHPQWQNGDRGTLHRPEAAV